MKKTMLFYFYNPFLDIWNLQNGIKSIIRKIFLEMKYILSNLLRDLYNSIKSVWIPYWNGLLGLGCMTVSTVLSCPFNSAS